jgi:pimeloyl-ACP methyl ester carboxylesterase
LPPESTRAQAELWLPLDADCRTPVVLHFAATGDQGFLRRRLLTLPLLKAGVGSLLLESPYYGRRRPRGQCGTRLRTVADLLNLIAASVCEGLALLRALEDAGYRRLGVCGISRGGQVAALTAALHPRPVALAAVVPAHSASVVFTQGVMENDCDWEALGGRREAQPRLSRCLEATDIRSFPSPVRPDAAVLVGSLWDAYIPPWSIQTLHRALPGSVLRWLSTGHIGSLLFHPRSLARAVPESFLRLGRT